MEASTHFRGGIYMRTAKEMIIKLVEPSLCEHQKDIIKEYLITNECIQGNTMGDCLKMLGTPELDELYCRVFLNEAEEVVEDEW